MPARRGTASSYIGHVDQRTFWIATTLCAGFAFASFRLQGLLVMAAAAVFTRIFRRYTERRIAE